MASLADLPEIIGFFSYSRDDDEDSHNALSTIRELIQNELRARLGRSRQSLRLWQDQEAIAPGSMWESQINAAVKQSVFFIPIITPRVINSKNCGVEFKRFLDREQTLRRDDLMFPILYIDVDELQDETLWRGHPVLEVIGQRQYVDWQEYRYDLESPALRRAVANLCTQITIALRRPPPNEKTEADDGAAAQKRAAERARKEQEEREHTAVAAAERTRQEEEAKRRAEQEQAFSRAKDADTAAAFSAFIAAYPESHLAGDAQKANARLLARDEAHGHLKADDDNGRAEQNEKREKAAIWLLEYVAINAEKARARLLARDEPPRQPKSQDQPPGKLTKSRSKRWPIIIGAVAVGILIIILIASNQ